MTRRTGVKGLVDDAAGELLKVLMHPRVIPVPIIDEIKTEKVPPIPQNDPETFTLEIEARSRGVKLVREVVSLREMSPVNAGPVKKESSFSAECREMEIVAPERSSSIQVPCIAPKSQPVRMSGFAFPRHCAMPVIDKIAHGQARKVILGSLVPDWIHRTPALACRRVVTNVNRMCDFPVVVEAVPWTLLDRKFIIACWELLRGQAVEEMGHDPGRSLEMLAVFTHVHPERFRGTGYDPATRALRLYPRYVDSSAESTGNSAAAHEGRTRSAGAECAIIVGTVRGTARLLQAVLRISPESS